jgi:hypothetical protein
VQDRTVVRLVRSPTARSRARWFAGEWTCSRLVESTTARVLTILIGWTLLGLALAQLIATGGATD